MLLCTGPSVWPAGPFCLPSRPGKGIHGTRSFLHRRSRRCRAPRACRPPQGPRRPRGRRLLAAAGSSPLPRGRRLLVPRRRRVARGRRAGLRRLLRPVDPGRSRARLPRRGGRAPRRPLRARLSHGVRTPCRGRARVLRARSGPRVLPRPRGPLQRRPPLHGGGLCPPEPGTARRRLRLGVVPLPAPRRRPPRPGGVLPGLRPGQLFPVALQGPDRPALGRARRGHGGPGERGLHLRAGGRPRACSGPARPPRGRGRPRPRRSPLPRRRGVQPGVRLRGRRAARQLVRHARPAAGLRREGGRVGHARLLHGVRQRAGLPAAPAGGGTRGARGLFHRRGRRAPGRPGRRLGRGAPRLPPDARGGARLPGGAHGRRQPAQHRGRHERVVLGPLRVPRRGGLRRHLRLLRAGRAGARRGVHERARRRHVQQRVRVPVRREPGYARRRRVPLHVLRPLRCGVAAQDAGVAGLRDCGPAPGMAHKLAP